jgi:hypothetical protein
MARVTHVAKAQQRYGTKPVIDPETGKPKRTPVMKGDGTQKTTREKAGRPGRPVYMTVTERDLNDPKPLYTCDSCREPIEIGTPYKHMSPKSGPYGGRKLTRHEGCPTWQVWEYSNSWSARIAQATSTFDVTNAETVEEVQEALDDVAAAIKELAEESRETASNIEEGFGHATQQSEDAESRADELDGWAEEIETVDIPDLPEPEEDDCEQCEGTGTVEVEIDGSDVPNEEDCEECGGTGQVTPDEPTEEQMDEWRENVIDACSIVDESPV